MLAFRKERITLLSTIVVGACAGFVMTLPIAVDAQQHGGGAGGGDAHASGGRKAENWKPIDEMHLYLCAFHTAKKNPSFQVEAHHYCSPQGKELHQCVVFDSRGPGQKLIGVEYIVPDEVYQKLPPEEKKYWHPHAYEILSGQLVAPDMPKMGDDVFPGLINTWGKTWHTWSDPTTPLPLGEPILMWSANGDGQIDQKLIDKRDAAFGIKTAEIRARRIFMGFGIPNIPPPKSVDELGRRWTPSGPDEPTKLSK